MAEEYGFKYVPDCSCDWTDRARYELVTYKWPHWLRAQTEKQRIIWAYKILFLDVLFPMDLDKIIFVDADQIVRTDMQELVDLDLQGHVYGYPPMGNSRTEMEGFRFWKTGYWKEALRGRPYHISALYVIDLKRFRQLATGVSTKLGGLVELMVGPGPASRPIPRPCSRSQLSGQPRPRPAKFDAGSDTYLHPRSRLALVSNMV